MKQFILTILVFVYAALVTSVDAQSVNASKDNDKSVMYDGSGRSDNSDSWATSINTASKTNDNIAVYPNPAHDEVNVVFTDMPEVKSISIYNLIGKAVSVFKVSGTSAMMDVANIPAGIYILRFMDAQGHSVAIRKFTHQ